MYWQPQLFQHCLAAKVALDRVLWVAEDMPSIPDLPWLTVAHRPLAEMHSLHPYMVDALAKLIDEQQMQAEGKDLAEHGVLMQLCKKAAQPFVQQGYQRHSAVQRKVTQGRKGSLLSRGRLASQGEMHRSSSLAQWATSAVAVEMDIDRAAEEMDVSIPRLSHHLPLCPPLPSHGCLTLIMILSRLSR